MNKENEDLADLVADLVESIINGEVEMFEHNGSMYLEYNNRVFRMTEQLVGMVNEALGEDEYDDN